MTRSARLRLAGRRRCERRDREQGLQAVNVLLLKRLAVERQEIGHGLLG
jgi:hypothetical protein